MSINNKGNPTEKDILDLAIQFKLSNEKCKEILEDIKYNISKDKNE